MLSYSPNEPKGLKHVDVFLQNAVWECHKNVQLVDGPIEVDGDGNKGGNCLPPDNKSKSVKKISAIFLFKATGN